MTGQDLPSVPGFLKLDLLLFLSFFFFSPISEVTLRAVASTPLKNAALKFQLPKNKIHSTY